MKLSVNKLLFFILIFPIIIFPSLASAYPGQTFLDPLHVQIQQSPLDREKYMWNLQNQETAWRQGLINNLTKPLSPQNNNVVKKTPDEICKQNYGLYSYYTNKNQQNGSYICDCMNGYQWNTNQSACIEKNVEVNNSIQNSNSPVCQANSTMVGSACACNEGYIMVGGNCISHTENCRRAYGNNTYGAKGNNNSNCYCSSGYDWNTNRNACIQQISIIEKEKSLTGKLDKNLANRLSGYILIQNELNFTPWYLNPKDKKRYLINSSTDLLRLIQTTSIFAGSKLMAAYNKNPVKALGRFILNTENSKGYYINPRDKKIYEIEYYTIGDLQLKSLGIGITNTDIRKIVVGEIK